MKNTIFNIIRKEFIDATRDRRSMMASMSVAIFGPIMLYVMIGAIAKGVDKEDDIVAALVGGAEAPTLVNWLEQRDISFVSFETDAEAFEAIGNDMRIVISFDEDYQKNYLERTTANISVYTDYKLDEAVTEAGRVERLIEGYGSQVSAARLVAQGVSPTRVGAIAVERYDLSRAGGNSVTFSGFLTYIFLMACFVSGAFMAADSIAGERERQSLQPLLSQPVSPLALVFGKWFVAASISAAVATVTIIFGGIMISKAPIAEVGLRFFTDPATLIMGALVLIPLCAIATSLQFLLAARAKTYREASTYAQYTTFFPVVMMLVTLVGGVESSGLANYLPMIGQNHVLRELLLEGKAPFLPMIGGALVSLAVAGLFVLMTARVLGSEKILD